MTALRGLIGLIGTLAVLMGLLWFGQGLGWIDWPADSFMLTDRTWARNGALLAIGGLGLIWFSQRRR